MDRRWIGCILLIALLSDCAIGCAQIASSWVSGQVTCNDGNIAARHAKVEFAPLSKLLPGATAEPGSGESQGTETDLNGNYEIVLPPGIWVANASLPGYANDLKWVRYILKSDPVEEQKKMVGALPQLMVKPGANAKLDLVLRRAGSITGHVSADDGGALENQNVVAALVLGKQTDVSPAGPHAPAGYIESTVTDDRGNYRIAGLPPGNYRVAIGLHEGGYRFVGMRKGVATLEPEHAGVAELTVYAPEALVVADAQSVHLEDGDELRGIDIVLPLRLLHSVGGRVSVNGVPAGGVEIVLYKPDGIAQATNAITMPDGSYRFDLLPQGNYKVEARAKTSPADESKTQRTAVSATLLDADVLDANLNLSVSE